MTKAELIKALEHVEDAAEVLTADGLKIHAVHVVLLSPNRTLVVVSDVDEHGDTEYLS